MTLIRYVVYMVPNDSPLIIFVSSMKVFEPSGLDLYAVMEKSNAD